MNLFGVSQTYYSKIAQEGKIIPDTARFSYNLRASVNISNNAASIRQPDHQAAGIQDIGLNIEGHPHRRTIDFNHFDLRLDLIDQNLFILSVSQLQTGLFTQRIHVIPRFGFTRKIQIISCHIHRVSPINVVSPHNIVVSSHVQLPFDLFAIDQIRVKRQRLEFLQFLIRKRTCRYRIGHGYGSDKPDCRP